MIKTVNQFTDPIELNESEAQQLVDSLSESIHLISFD